MSYTQLPTRVPNTDTASAADVNQLQTNIEALKGGTGSVAPTQTIEGLAALLAQDAYNADTSTAQTIVYTDGNQTYNPTSDHDVNLPTTSVPAGWARRIVNRSATKVLTIKASGGNTLCKLIPKAWVIVQARQATPTAETHWMQVDAGGGWADWGGTSSNFGAGYGTMGTIAVWAARRGANLVLRGRYQIGTVSAATGRVLLPHSLSMLSSQVEDSITTFGYYNMVYNAGANTQLWATGNDSGVFWYRATDGVTYLQLGPTYSAGTYEYQTVNGFVASGASIVFPELVIPIDGWQLG